MQATTVRTKWPFLCEMAGPVIHQFVLAGPPRPICMCCEVVFTSAEPVPLRASAVAFGRPRRREAPPLILQRQIRQRQFHA
jgi:hypothetical protein